MIMAVMIPGGKAAESLVGVKSIAARLQCLMLHSRAGFLALETLDT